MSKSVAPELLRVDGDGGGVIEATAGVARADEVAAMVSGMGEEA